MRHAAEAELCPTGATRDGGKPLPWYRAEMICAACGRTKRMAELNLAWGPADEMVAAEFYRESEIPSALRTALEGTVYWCNEAQDYVEAPGLEKVRLFPVPVGVHEIRE